MIKNRVGKDRNSSFLLGHFLLCLLASISGLQAQFVPPLFGKVIEAKSGLVIPGLYVVNTRTEQGVLTDKKGLFEIFADKGDTLIFSHLSFRFTTHEITGEEPIGAEFKMYERNYLLDEVGIYSYALTTNRPKEIKLSKPYVPSNEDIIIPHHAPPGMSSPIDMLYERFGKTPRQLAELREQMRKDAFKQKLAGKNREILSEITGMSEDEIRRFAFYCRYSTLTIMYATDYQLLESMMSCYDMYLEERAMQELLEEYD